MTIPAIDGDRLEARIVDFVRRAAGSNIELGPPHQANDLLDYKAEDREESLQVAVGVILNSLQSDVMVQLKEPWPRVPNKGNAPTRPFARFSRDRRSITIGFASYEDDIVLEIVIPLRDISLQPDVQE